MILQTDDVVQAWHFTNGKLRGGRDLPAEGEWLEHSGEVTLCNSGLHASEQLIDALCYARGTMLHRVDCAEVVAKQDDKFVCRRRRIVWTVDAKSVLRDFARWCAWQVIDKWEAPAVVREFLTTGDENKMEDAQRAVRRVARKYAWNSAPNSNAWNAAWGAAGCVVPLAARGAAWEAARDISWEAVDRQLTAMVMSLHRGEYETWHPELERELT